MTWGDNGAARPTTEAYSNGFDRIFGGKSKKVEPEQPADKQKSDSAIANEREANELGQNGGDSRKSNKGDDE